MDAHTTEASSRMDVVPMANSMGKLTVAKCQKLYRNHGDVFLQDTRDVVNVIREKGQSRGLKNSNYFHALTLTHVMLEHTSSAFRMITGADGDEFLGCLDNAFRDMLERLRQANQKAKVILLDGEPKYLSGFRDDYSDVLEYELATVAEDNTVNHFIVCDDDMSRDEQPHDPIDNDEDASTIKATVDFSNRAKAGLLAARFDRIWRQLRGE